MRQGGLLAWLLCSKGGVFGGEAVDHQGIVSGEERGEETINIKQTKAHNTKHGGKRCRMCSIAVLHANEKRGKPFRESVPGSGYLSDR